MGTNATYRGAEDLPQVFPVFPLAGALLLPRGQLPLNIFEPRYVTMVDDVMKSHRVLGMIQPDPDAASTRSVPPLLGVGCAGRITQLAETGDGRYILTLTGIARFRVMEEITALTPYRQCRVEFSPYAADFTAHENEDVVDRAGVLKTLRDFAEVNNLQIDWRSIDTASNEALVNALSMMSPFGPKEKQALLEASDLKCRADVLVAITEIEIARGRADGPSPLQ